VVVEATHPRQILEAVDLSFGEFVFYFFHVYKVTQNSQKARDFFTINETFFVDKHPPIFEKNSYERLNFWSLGPIFKTLQLLNLSFFYLSGG
jgi:hypothetical protein